MSPAGAVPNVPAVAPLPSPSARSLALAPSRPMTSTAWPPSIAASAHGALVGPESDDADAGHDVCCSFLWDSSAGPVRVERVGRVGCLRRVRARRYFEPVRRRS